MKFRIIKETRHDRPNHPRYYPEVQMGFLFKTWEPVLLSQDSLWDPMKKYKKYFYTEEEAERYINSWIKESKRMQLAAKPPKAEIVKEFEKEPDSDLSKVKE